MSDFFSVRRNVGRTLEKSDIFLGLANPLTRQALAVKRQQP